MGCPDRFRSICPVLPHFRETGVDEPFCLMHRATGMDPPLSAGGLGDFPYRRKSIPQLIGRWLHLDSLIGVVPTEPAKLAGFRMLKIIGEPFHRNPFFLNPFTLFERQDRWQPLFLFGSLPEMDLECWAASCKPGWYSVPDHLWHGSCLHRGSAALLPDLPHQRAG